MPSSQGRDKKLLIPMWTFACKMSAQPCNYHYEEIANAFNTQTSFCCTFFLSPSTANDFASRKGQVYIELFSNNKNKKNNGEK